MVPYISHPKRTTLQCGIKGTSQTTPKATFSEVFGLYMLGCTSCGECSNFQQKDTNLLAVERKRQGHVGRCRISSYATNYLWRRVRGVLGRPLTWSPQLWSGRGLGAKVLQGWLFSVVSFGRKAMPSAEHLVVVAFVRGKFVAWFKGKFHEKSGEQCAFGGCTTHEARY